MASFWFAEKSRIVIASIVLLYASSSLAAIDDSLLRSTVTPSFRLYLKFDMAELLVVVVDVVVDVFALAVAFLFVDFFVVLYHW